MERLAHLEQLVVQLKGLIRDKDTQLTQKDEELASKDAQFKAGGRSRRSREFSRAFSHAVVVCLQSEKEELDARFTKLKLQAKAKMASLNKQISELKGQGGATVNLTEAETSANQSAVTDACCVLQQSPESSFTTGGEEELQELKNKLSEEEINNRELQERLRHAQQLLEEKEAAHAEQVTCKFVRYLILYTFKKTSHPHVCLFPRC